MAGAIGKYAAKKMLGKQMEQYKSKDPVKNDPYFTYVVDKRGRKKKVKKQIPDYIPEHDALILAKMRSRAYKLDCSLFTLLGQRFGWSSVIGLAPGFGDFADFLLAVNLIFMCNKVECGLDGFTWGRMWINCFVDLIIGLVPFLGDLLDAMFKANTQNLVALEKRLDDVYKPKAANINPNYKAAEGYEIPAASVLEDFSSDDERPTGDGRSERYEPRRPEPARQPRETRGGAPPEAKKSRGWFGGSRRERKPDVEMGADSTRPATNSGGSQRAGVIRP